MKKGNCQLLLLKVTAPDTREMRNKKFVRSPAGSQTRAKVDAHLIVKKIQARRKELGFTQESLAEALDMSPGTIKTIEQGIRTPAS